MLKSALFAAALAAATGCTHSAGEQPQAATSPEPPPAPAADPPKPLDPATLGPTKGSPCDFENDGVPLFPAGVEPDEPMDLRLLDPGQEPRMILQRAAAQRPERWLMTVEQTLDMGVKNVHLDRMVPPMHHVATMQFVVERRTTERALRLTVATSDVSDLRLIGDDVSEEMWGGLLEGVKKSAVAPGTYVDLFRDDQGQTTNMVFGNEGAEGIGGKLYALNVVLPDVPVGPGARWTQTLRRGPIAITMAFRLIAVNAGVATVEAKVTVVMGPYRQRLADQENEIHEMWVHDEMNETWVIDPGTPVTGFHGTRLTQNFFATCRNGRIALTRSVMDAKISFKPAP